MSNFITSLVLYKQKLSVKDYKGPTHLLGNGMW